MTRDEYKPREPGRLLTLEDVAYWMSLGRKQAQDALDAGDLPPPIILGGQRRWRKKDITRFIRAKVNATFSTGFDPDKNTVSIESPRTDFPAELADIHPSLQEFRLHRENPCVYFLMHLGTIVYVGKSKRVPIRVHQHLRGSPGTPKKDFDRVLFYPVEEEKLDKAENYFIMLLNPIHNRTGTAAISPAD